MKAAAISCVSIVAIAYRCGATSRDALARARMSEMSTRSRASSHARPFAGHFGLAVMTSCSAQMVNESILAPSAFKVSVKTRKNADDVCFAMVGVETLEATSRRRLACSDIADQTDYFDSETSADPR